MATHSPHPPGSNLLYTIFIGAEQKRYQNTNGIKPFKEKRKVKIKKNFLSNIGLNLGHALASFAFVVAEL